MRGGGGGENFRPRFRPRVFPQKRHVDNTFTPHTSMHAYAPPLALGASPSAAPSRFRGVSSSRGSVRPLRAVASVSSATKLEGEALATYMSVMSDDLSRLFTTGIDKSLYAPNVSFEDPLTTYDTIDGYLFNISMLKNVFDPVYTMHSIAQTGDWEVSTRWTMAMSLPTVPFFWAPSLTFTGTSVMGIDPDTKQVTKHFDTWDAISQQGFFMNTGSTQGVAEVMRQVLDITKQPALETPQYVVLRRYAEYEVRRYDPFLVAETRTNSNDADQGDRLGAGGMTGLPAGGNPFGTLAGYLFGGNEEKKSMAMTTPVFTGGGKMQFVMPKSVGGVGNAPVPNDPAAVAVTEQPGGVFAAIRFAGIATDAHAKEREDKLLQLLGKDELVADKNVPASLAQYNDPLTNPVQRRNDVLVKLQSFDVGRLDK